MSNTQDLGHYIPQVRAAGVRLNTNEPFVLGGVQTGVLGTLPSAATVTFTPSNIVTTHTPTVAETINFASPSSVGTVGVDIFLKVVTSGATSYTLTFGANTKSQGTLATGTTTGKTFVVEFVSDGTNWVEAGRTTAM